MNSIMYIPVTFPVAEDAARRLFAEAARTLGFDKTHRCWPDHLRDTSCKRYDASGMLTTIAFAQDSGNGAACFSHEGQAFMSISCGLGNNWTIEVRPRFSLPEAIARVVNRAKDLMLTS